MVSLLHSSFIVVVVDQFCNGLCEVMRSAADVVIRPAARCRGCWDPISKQNAEARGRLFAVRGVPMIKVFASAQTGPRAGQVRVCSTVSRTVGQKVH